MHTLLTRSPDEAAAFIRRGQVVAFPTETVYGLGADAFDEQAVRRIFAAKGRPADNPLITHIARHDQLDQLVRHVPPAALRLIEHFFPGPLTLILPKRPGVPSAVTAGLDTVGVRMPMHPVAFAFLEACGRPVAAPSANLSGRPSPTTWEAVHADLGGRIPCLLQGDPTTVGLESTVVDCTESTPVVLRAGGITIEQIDAVAPGAAFASRDPHLLARSPGTRYRHYAPSARVIVVDQTADASPEPAAGYIGLDLPAGADQFGLYQQCTDVVDYARNLFHFFRRSDAAGLARIYCQAVERRGLGLALMDRIERAARG